jgi:hypothetical protein
MPWSARFD